ncbi:DNA alkylation repair protein [Desmospora profundinema]|uniref:3-methyladenine DNA glycosylase AlkC n=1 Tax=Desmospora profundinema TaxID=1571184 RepID=A0ABU1IQ07_9BACL|nr:DNA alkylation repair protein [Desmospora profundinema]MDR6226872.1 3-methyladenine DNA glycosylase AlkC [Desmospora profundinema]
MKGDLKNRYNSLFFKEFSSVVKRAYPSFDDARFMDRIFDQEWEHREFKQRMRHVTHCLHATMAMNYSDAVSLLMSIAEKCRGLEYLFFPDYVEVYGLADWECSMAALERFTAFSSAEFAVRRFMMHSPARMMSQMVDWARHPDHHVRRLASEGCRPRLPWAKPIPFLREDPAPVLPILETLKADESEYVRKSVANHINDISKDHPGLVLDLARQWAGSHPRTDWILKHGCRTLLKKGNREALDLFGFYAPAHVTVNNLSLKNRQIRLGDSLEFTFQLCNQASSPQHIRLEYAIDYVKAKGSTSRKVFKISEKSYPSGRTEVVRRQRFKDLTTRKHYEGWHRLAVIVNGHSLAEETFYLSVPPVGLGEKA